MNKTELTLAVGTIKPACAFVTEVGHLRLAINAHSLVSCPNSIIEAILLLARVLDDEILLALDRIFE